MRQSEAVVVVYINYLHDNELVNSNELYFMRWKDRGRVRVEKRRSYVLRREMIVINMIYSD